MIRKHAWLRGRAGAAAAAETISSDMPAKTALAPTPAGGNLRGAAHSSRSRSSSSSSGFCP
jgi:hypothetical protein